MRQLLRSTFVADPNESLDLHSQNYYALLESGLGFEMPEDNTVWAFIQDFFKQHGHVPSLQSMRTHFERVKEVGVVERLESLRALKPRTRGDFLTYLEEKATDRRNKLVLDIAKEMTQITSMGLDIKDAKGKVTKLLGGIDAIRWALDKSHDIVAPTLGSKLSGNLMQDGDDFMSRYDRVKSDPNFGIGQFCGISQIDAVLKGAKRYELWIHAAFTGGLKSTFALHWAYIQAVYFGFSSIYFSLEMPYLQVRNIIYSMHTAHEDFTDIRKQLGIETLGLDYEKIRDGELTDNEERFLREYVVPDMNKTPTVPHNGPHSRDARDYGDIYIEVADPDKNDFTMVDLRSKSELIFSKTPFEAIFVDHIGLLGSRGRYNSTTEKLNEVVRDLKKLAMSFNRGMGIAVIALAQLSREGFKAAEKNGGRYNLTHLSYANEIERSADVVTASWVDEALRNLNRAIFQWLKSRDSAPFNRVPVRVEFSCRRLITDDTMSIDELDQKVKDARGDDDDAPRKNRRIPHVDIELDLS